MFILIIFSLLTGEIMIEEKGFRSKPHCESRAKAFITPANDDRYKHACIRGEKHGSSLGSSSSEGGIQDSA